MNDVIHHCERAVDTSDMKLYLCDIPSSTCRIFSGKGLEVVLKIIFKRRAFRVELVLEKYLRQQL
jgi:hypothetical protein